MPVLYLAFKFIPFRAWRRKARMALTQLLGWGGEGATRWRPGSTFALDPATPTT